MTEIQIIILAVGIMFYIFTEVILAETVILDNYNNGFKWYEVYKPIFALKVNKATKITISIILTLVSLLFVLSDNQNCKLFNSYRGVSSNEFRIYH